jgi:glycosyltransferase involved in cell wall biosynthesis
VSRIAADAPPVSIVMATYNRAHLAPESIESVLGQDYPDLELLVVDDGSGDETPAMLAGYARRHPEQRFRFVRQDNAGQATALNRGFELARGEIIGYLCDDDLLNPGAISLQAQALIDDPEAAIAYPGYREIDAAGRVEDTVRPIEYSPTEALRLHDTVIVPGALIRRRALEASGGWEASMQWMADLVFWMDVGLNGRAIRISQPLVSWRRHAGSVTVNLGPEHAREHLAAFARGLALARLPRPTAAVRAEALRNACVFGAIFAGAGDTWPGDRFMVFDLHRKLISAGSAGFAPGSEPDWAEVEASAGLFRELVATIAGSEAQRAAPADPEAAFASAVERLRSIGALPRPDGSLAEIDEASVRVDLLEVAESCGAPVDPRGSRFVIVDRRRTAIPDGDLELLEGLGFAASADRLRTELELRRAN